MWCSILSLPEKMNDWLFVSVTMLSRHLGFLYQSDKWGLFDYKLDNLAPLYCIVGEHLWKTCAFFSEYSTPSSPKSAVFYNYPRQNVIQLWPFSPTANIFIGPSWLSSVRFKYKPGYKPYVTCYKFNSSHWLQLQHPDWRANLVKDFFLNNFSTNESTQIYNRSHGL